MAILVQELFSPDFSFVLHTVSPIDGDASKLYAEVAVGLGETLASGTRGTAWRLLVDKSTGKTSTLAFANFSEAMVVSSSSSPSSLKAGSEGTAGLSGRVSKVRVDYSKQKLSVDADMRAALGARLAAVGNLLEESFGSPQDVEGGVVGDEIWICQSRPQPL